MDLDSPVPPSPEEVYAEYGFSGLVEQVEREVDEDDEDDEWETVDEERDGRDMVYDEEAQFGPEMGYGLGIGLGLEPQGDIDVGESEEVGTEEADVYEAEDCNDVGDDNINDENLPTAYGYEQLDSDDSEEGHDYSDSDSDRYDYHPDFDNTEHVLEKLAKYVVEVKKLLEQYPELGEMPSSAELSVGGQDEESPGTGDQRAPGGNRLDPESETDVGGEIVDEPEAMEPEQIRDTEPLRDPEQTLDTEQTLNIKRNPRSELVQVRKDELGNPRPIVAQAATDLGRRDDVSGDDDSSLNGLESPDARPEWQGEDGDVVMEEPLD